MEFIFFSDTHFQKLKKLFPDTHLKICINEFRKPLEYAVKNGIKTVIHGGDLFDSPNAEHSYIKSLISLLLDFKELNIYIILGNHDVEDSDNNSLNLIKLCHDLKILPNVKVMFEPNKDVIEGIPFNFMPFPCSKFSKKPMVNIAHLETAGVIRDNNTKVKTGIETTTTNNLNFIGHIHKQQKVGENTWFCGGLYQTTFGERNPKGWYHANVKFKNGKWVRKKIKFIKNNCSFELVNLNIEVKDDFDKITKDESTLYKLHISEGIVVPPSLTTKYPNVITIVGSKNGEELSVYTKELPQEMYEGSNVLDSLINDPLWGLFEFLKQEGLSKKERRRGVEIVKELLVKTK
jgi:DNA repair exonuclease SbcCD nuclease subunit